MEDLIPDRKGSATDHLANERTLLAWVRTSVGIMAFGFVVVKFSLFVRQISAAFGKPLNTPQTGYSHLIGILFVGLGALTIAFSYFRYINTKRQLDSGYYYHSTLLIKILTALIFITSICLLVYLMKTT